MNPTVRATYTLRNCSLYSKYNCSDDLALVPKVTGYKEGIFVHVLFEHIFMWIRSSTPKVDPALSKIPVWVGDTSGLKAGVVSQFAKSVAKESVLKPGTRAYDLFVKESLYHKLNITLWEEIRLSNKNSFLDFFYKGTNEN